MLAEIKFSKIENLRLRRQFDQMGAAVQDHV